MTADLSPEDRERLTAESRRHGPAGFVNSREGWIECLCGERLSCAVLWRTRRRQEDDEDRAWAEHRADALAPEVARIRDEAVRQAVADAEARVQRVVEAVRSEREHARRFMLTVETTDDRDTYSDGFGRGVAYGIDRMDAALQAAQTPQEGA